MKKENFLILQILNILNFFAQFQKFHLVFFHFQHAIP